MANSLFNELKHQYRIGEITTDQLLAMLNANKITLSEYIKVIHEADSTNRTSVNNTSKGTKSNTK